MSFFVNFTCCRACLIKNHSYHRHRRYFCVLRIRFYTTLTVTNATQDIRRELSGESNQNLDHIMMECGVELELRGTVHIATHRRLGPAAALNQHDALHFLVRATEEKTMNHAQDLIDDLVQYKLSSMMRRQSREKQQQQDTQQIDRSPEG